MPLLGISSAAGLISESKSLQSSINENPSPSKSSSGVAMAQSSSIPLYTTSRVPGFTVGLLSSQSSKVPPAGEKLHRSWASVPIRIRLLGSSAPRNVKVVL